MWYNNERKGDAIMQYFIDSQDGSLHAAQNCNDKEPFFTVMSTAEFHECKEQLPYYKELLHLSLIHI